MESDPRYYIKGILSRNRRILARAITLIESSRQDHQKTARAIIDGILAHTGKSIRIGITGVPGAGKSTLIETLGMHLLNKGHHVAVLAVDPSSSKSGGSIMADKTRMEKLSAEKNAFIRPSPSGGTLGGVARKTRETMLACEAAGFDVVMVETVGVGQSETAVASMVDFFLLMLLAGAGDEIQGIKKGILELADLIAINKADGNNVNNAEQARREYDNALHLFTSPSQQWKPAVVTCSATEFTGITEIWDIVLKHKKIFEQQGLIAEKRRQQALDWMWTLLEDELKERFYKNSTIKKLLPEVTRAVKKGEISATTAASRLLENI